MRDRDSLAVSLDPLFLISLEILGNFKYVLEKSSNSLNFIIEFYPNIAYLAPEDLGSRIPLYSYDVPMVFSKLSIDISNDLCIFFKFVECANVLLISS